MSRKIKAVGLALVAVLALSAVVASAAQAEKFTAAQYPANLTGKQTTTKVLSFEGRKFECGQVAESGTLSEPSEGFEITSESSECTTEIAGTKFPSKTTVSCKGSYSHTVFLSFTHETCSFGYTHHVAAFKDAKMTELLCLYDISELGKKEGVTQKNLGGTNGVEITYNLTGITYERKEGTALLCGPNGKATFKGSSTFTAKNSEGEPITFDIG